jgi:hypothetical protein
MHKRQHVVLQLRKPWDYLKPVGLELVVFGLVKSLDQVTHGSAVRYLPLSGLKLFLLSLFGQSLCHDQYPAALAA